MSKSAEVEKMARLALSRQAETDMRVDAVETGVKAAAGAAAAADGGRAAPVAAPSLDGLYGWRPKAFSVWFTTGGGGRVGVSFPEKCVSYNGNHMDDGVLTPAVQEDRETKFRWCELEAPSEGAPKLVLTLLVELDGATHEPGDEVTVAYLEWAASVDAAKADHEETDRKVVACVPIAEYDAKLDRLSQVHVGALALGGGGGGGGGVTPDGASTEFRGGTGEHAGELQLVDFHDFDASKDEGTLADYLADGTKADDYQCLVRGRATGGHTQNLGYVPLGKLEPPYKAGDNIEISEPGTDGKRTISAQVPSPDGSSLEKNASGEVQVKGWNGGTPVSDTTLADDLQAQYAVQGHVLFRDANGALKYKPIGQLSGGGGHSFCGAFSYDPDTHTIKDGMYLRARQWYEVAEATVSAAGYAYLEVGMEATSFTVSIVTGASSIPARTRYKTYVPLYWFNANLEPTHDYRGAPTIQIWEYMS